MNVIIVTQNERLYLPGPIHSICEACEEDIVAVVAVSPMSTHGGFWKGLMRHVRLFGFFGMAQLLCRLLTTYLYSFMPFDHGDRVHSLKEVARRHDIGYHTVSDVNGEHFKRICQENAADLLVSMSCPQIIRSETRDLFDKGCINVHSAPLPRYRGLMPCFWVLRNNETETAVTVHEIADNLDDGAIYLQKEVAISPEDTWDSLVKKTKRVGASAIIEVVGQIKEGKKRPVENDDAGATYFSFPQPEDRKAFLKNGRRFF